VSKESLYAAMKKLYKMDSYDHCLSKVDYGELREWVREQYWCCFKGQEVSFSFSDSDYACYWRILRDEHRN